MVVKMEVLYAGFILIGVAVRDGLGSEVVKNGPNDVVKIKLKK